MVGTILLKLTLMKDGSTFCEFKTGTKGRAGGSTEIQRADESSFGEIRTDQR
jgi:hypothetical protein